MAPALSEALGGALSLTVPPLLPLGVDPVEALLEARAVPVEVPRGEGVTRGDAEPHAVTRGESVPRDDVEALAHTVPLSDADGEEVPLGLLEGGAVAEAH